MFFIILFPNLFLISNKIVYNIKHTCGVFEYLWCILLKMVLITSRMMFTWLGMCSLNEQARNWRKFFNAFVILTTLISVICIIIVHFAFAWKFLTINLDEPLFAVVGICNGCSMLYTIIIGILHRRKMDEIFEILSEIHDASES